jgi:hypothetical protein
VLSGLRNLEDPFGANGLVSAQQLDELPHVVLDVRLHLAHHGLMPQLRVRATHGVAMRLGLCVGRNSPGVNGSTERVPHGLGQLNVLVVVVVDGVQALCAQCANVRGRLNSSVQC